ncbi:hypothetical protein R2360_13680 [Mycobacteroides chelonae]|nr:hypothetical protein [Mycobacteroides chelonae]MEC4843335.1 hypothetical protein [Mycobacteroides chelonae]
MFDQLSVAFAAVPAITAVVTAAVALRTAQLNGGLGQVTRLRQQATGISNLLATLPDDTHGHAQLRTELDEITFELAYLLEFRKKNGTTKLVVSSAVVFATILSECAIALHYRTFSYVSLVPWVPYLVALNVFGTTLSNQDQQSGLTRKLFRYVNAEQGLHTVAKLPSGLILRYQPYASDVEKLAEEKLAQDKQIGGQLTKLQATKDAWREAFNELNSPQHCPWYHRIVLLRRLTELFANPSGVFLRPQASVTVEARERRQAEYDAQFD